MTLEVIPARYENSQYLVEKSTGERLPTGAKPLKRLKPWHKQAIALHIAGTPSGVVAKIFKKRPSTISILLGDPLAQAIIQRFQTLYNHEFHALHGKAVDAVRDGLECPDVDTKLKAAGVYFKEQEKREGKKKSERTAEDVIQEVMGRMSLNIQVNVENKHE